MAYFPIPDNPTFNVTQVERVKQTDPVVDTHINPYFETFLHNDQYLKKKEESDAQLLQQLVNETKQTLQVEISKKLDGNGTVTDYAEAISKTETGTVPDTTIIARMYSNFLAGCRTIARAITGGRDGNGTDGIPTADNASPTTMATNIKALAQRNYAKGAEVAMGTAPTFSGSFTSATPGSASNYEVKATSDGYITNGSVANSRSATTTAQLEAPEGGGVVDINVAPGFYNKIKINLKKAYDAGTAAIVNIAATFTHAFSNTTAGAASNLNVTCASAGYVAKDRVVRTIAAATSPTIATTAASGTQTINVTPGVYNKVSVNQKPAYDAGVTAADNRVNTNSANYKGGYNAGVAAQKSAIGAGTVGTGKFHSVGSGTTITTGTEGLYLGICLYGEDRSYHGEITFSRNGTIVSLDFGRVDKTYPDGGTSYTNFVARAACLLEYCPAGTTLSCNRNAYWYRVY